MKYKFALLCASAIALSGCNKNDIDCGDSSVQNDLINRLISAMVLEGGGDRSTPDLLKQLKVTFKDFAQDNERATETSAQCTATATLVDSQQSGQAMAGSFHYELNKGADGKVKLDADSVRLGLNLDNFKTIKIDETPEQKEWREAQEKAKAEQARQEEARKAEEAAKKAEAEKQIAAAQAIPDSDFKAINADDLMLLFLANSARKVTDDEKLGLLSNRWNAENDPFKRNDMKQDELAKADEEIAKFKGVKYIKVSKMLSRLNRRQESVKKEIITDAYLSISKPQGYDFTNKIFPIDVAGCGSSLEFGPATFYRSRQNISIMMEKSIIQCKITPANEDEARSISGVLSNIPDNNFGAEGTAYLMVTGYEPNKALVNTVLVREDISIFRYAVDALNDKSPLLNFTLK